MNQHQVHTSKGLLWACISVLALSFSMPAVATTASTSPEAGSYCPGRDILLVVAEDLSASLDMAMRSRAALVKGDCRPDFGRNRPASGRQSRSGGTHDTVDRRHHTGKGGRGLCPDA